MKKQLSSLTKVATRKQTYLNLFFLLLSFPLGIASFVAVVVLTTVPLSFIASPLLFFLGDIGAIDTNYVIGPFNFMDTYWFTIVLGIVGIFMLFISLHIFNILARVFVFLTRIILRNEVMQKQTEAISNDIAHEDPLSQ